jgi:hypothetical protein
MSVSSWPKRQNSFWCVCWVWCSLSKNCYALLFQFRNVICPVPCLLWAGPSSIANDLFFQIYMVPTATLYISTLLLLLANLACRLDHQTCWLVGFLLNTVIEDHEFSFVDIIVDCAPGCFGSCSMVTHHILYAPFPSWSHECRDTKCTTWP